MEWLNELGAGCLILVLIPVVLLAGLSFYIGFELHRFWLESETLWLAVVAMWAAMPWPVGIFVGGWIFVVILLALLIFVILL